MTLHAVNHCANALEGPRLHVLLQYTSFSGAASDPRQSHVVHELDYTGSPG